MVYLASTREEGRSGKSSKNTDRPEFQRLLADYPEPLDFCNIVGGARGAHVQLVALNDTFETATHQSVPSSARPTRPVCWIGKGASALGAQWHEAEDWCFVHAGAPSRFDFVMGG